MAGFVRTSLIVLLLFFAPVGVTAIVAARPLPGSGGGEVSQVTSFGAVFAQGRVLELIRPRRSVVILVNPYRRCVLIMLVYVDLLYLEQ
jgi:hypothetical protein